jgi:hypothetical protein
VQNKKKLEDYHEKREVYFKAASSQQEFPKERYFPDAPITPDTLGARIPLDTP